VSIFGVGRSYNGGPVDSYHEGVDIKNRAGTPIAAAARGRVVLAEPNFVARGGAVVLDHGWGIHTGYWHMQQVLVSEGQLVESRQVIGLMGAHGMATGPHLHWEVHIGPTSVDPLEWVEREWLAEGKER
jgi:murein DD-endopeptidase MepM/ murein hydrolase activator NlpD